MNYTHLKIGFVIAVAVFGAVFTHNVYEGMTELMEQRTQQIETLTKGI